jgi:hypothetical protein
LVVAAYAPGSQAPTTTQWLQHDRKTNLFDELSGVFFPRYQSVPCSSDSSSFERLFQAGLVQRTAHRGHTHAQEAECFAGLGHGFKQSLLRRKKLVQWTMSVRQYSCGSNQLIRIMSFADADQIGEVFCSTWVWQLFADPEEFYVFEPFDCLRAA